jgi:LysM repeat protein
MNNSYRNYIFFAFLLGTFLFTACTRSASTQPAYGKTPIAISEVPQIVSLTPGFSVTPSLTLASPPSITPSPTIEAPPPKPTTEENVPQSEDSQFLGQHIVQTGETLYMIGRAYKVLPEAIAEANDIANPDSIDPGMILNIPRQKWENVPTCTIANQQFSP